MIRNVRIQNAVQRHPGGGAAITTRRKLLTDFWTADVEALETAIGRFKASGSSANDCHVVCFEIVGDEHLHVNVTHKHPTAVMKGWAGPAAVSEGFVHNRRFGVAQAHQMIDHVREVVFAVCE